MLCASGVEVSGLFAKSRALEVAGRAYFIADVVVSARTGFVIGGVSLQNRASLAGASLVGAPLAKGEL